MGQINAKAHQAEIKLGQMIVSAHKTGDPVDRSNKEIGVALEEFEKKINHIMEVQEFFLEDRPSDYYNLACFSPHMVADKLLKVTRAHVKKTLTKNGVDTSDLTLNDIKPPNFTSNCYKYEPFGFSPWLKSLSLGGR
ncbi:MAG: hypothetical protein ABL867_05160 [Rickettsiales bacterium]